MTTVRPGVIPRALSSAVSRATSARTALATATPSITVAPLSATPSLRACGLVSACKVDSPRFTNYDHLDLSRILKLCLDAPSDFVRQGRHARVVHILRRHQH